VSQRTPPAPPGVALGASSHRSKQRVASPRRESGTAGILRRFDARRHPRHAARSVKQNRPALAGRSKAPYPQPFQTDSLGDSSRLFGWGSLVNSRRRASDGGQWREGVSVPGRRRKRTERNVRRQAAPRAGAGKLVCHLGRRGLGLRMGRPAPNASNTSHMAPTKDRARKDGSDGRPLDFWTVFEGLARAEIDARRRRRSLSTGTHAQHIEVGFRASRLRCHESDFNATRP
jgi:hypothetical protein